MATTNRSGWTVRSSEDDTVIDRFDSLLEASTALAALDVTTAYLRLEEPITEEQA